jgi:hypothetical protein
MIWTKQRPWAGAVRLTRVRSCLCYTIDSCLCIHSVVDVCHEKKQHYQQQNSLDRRVTCFAPTSVKTSWLARKLESAQDQWCLTQMVVMSCLRGWSRSTCNLTG